MLPQGKVCCHVCSPILHDLSFFSLFGIPDCQIKMNISAPPPGSFKRHAVQLPGRSEGHSGGLGWKSEVRECSEEGGVGGRSDTEGEVSGKHWSI